MIKAIALMVIMATTAASNSFAHDTDRLDQLEREIRDLKLRLNKLESADKPENNTQAPTSFSEGWKFLTNWRKLEKGMNPAAVRKILGEPERIMGGVFTEWYYPEHGSVTFHDDGVYRWAEPRR
jgi:hypothetical protein